MEGTARGRDLRYQQVTAEALDLRLDVVRPLDTRGTVRLDPRDVRAGGLQLRTLALRAEGEPAAHRLELDVDGDALQSAARC